MTHPNDDIASIPATRRLTDLQRDILQDLLAEMYVTYQEQLRIRLHRSGKLSGAVQARFSVSDLVQSAAAKLCDEIARHDYLLLLLETVTPETLLNVRVESKQVDNLRRAFADMRDVRLGVDCATLSDQLITSDSVEEEAIANELLLRLREALTNLSKEQLEAFRLAMEGRSSEEIGANTGCTANAARQRVFAARTRIRQFLGDDERS